MEEKRKKLLGMTLAELQDAAVSCNLKPFVGRQLADWLYDKRVSSFDGMRNISAAAKEVLSSRFDLGTSAPSGRALSSDGTCKYLFDVGSSSVESVVIPEFSNEEGGIEGQYADSASRRTVCISTQSGCKMNCSFCMTGRQGWHGNLDAGDILNQFLGVDDPAGLTNAVYMGMGEPLDNYDAVARSIEILTAPWGFGWSPKRITVSTVGVIPVLRRFLDEQHCHLAVSLHNPFPDERASVMPAQKAWPIYDVIDLLRHYDFSGQRRVSFEYTMFAGFNDDKRHADALIRLLRGLECRVNLIRFHSIPDFPYRSSSEKVMGEFRNRLNNNGIICTIRASRGEDILAACGMLAGKH